MACAVRIFNHVPPVRMAKRVNTDWARYQIDRHPVEAIICAHRTAHPIPDMEWALAVMLGIGSSELALFADNDEDAFDWIYLEA